LGLYNDKEVVSVFVRFVPLQLLDWEAGKPKLLHWKKMNQWVYDGFAQTYTDLGASILILILRK
jgi:hypothetical protein